LTNCNDLNYKGQTVISNYIINLAYNINIFFFFLEILYYKNINNTFINIKLILYKKKNFHQLDLIYGERWEKVQPLIYCFDDKTESSGFKVGNNKTSLIVFESVKNIANLSIPQPQPPVGGKPYSKALTKVSSTN